MTVAIKPDRLSTVAKRKYQKYVARLKKSKGGVEQPAYYIISIVISNFVKMFEHYFICFITLIRMQFTRNMTVLDD